MVHIAVAKDAYVAILVQTAKIKGKRLIIS